MIIGILGFAGSGKDSVADILCKRHFQKIGFADRLKRVCMEIFGFSKEQMWGNIELKEAPDLRYLREHHVYKHPDPICQCCGMNTAIAVDCYLTPRYAMKMVGTEGARAAWKDIWVKGAIEDAKKIEAGASYSQRYGINLQVIGTDHESKGAIFIDNRFINEVNALLAAGAQVYRIKRKGFDKPMFDHPSETEQLQIPDDRLHGVITNDGTLEDLEEAVLGTVRLA
jgi:hypothetical protein